jgi:hypothetical protein
VNLQKGDLQIRGNGTMSATSQVNASAGTNVFFTADYTILSGAKFTGPGTFRQLGGTLTLNGLLQASLFTWSGGNWNAADNSGLLTTVASGSTLLLADYDSNTRDFFGRGIVNQGVVQWTSGYLRGGNGSTFTNASGGVFRDENASGYTIHNPVGGSFTFLNEGLYLKASGGTTAVGVPFSNKGVLNLTAGAMNFQSSFTTTGGALNLANGATVQFAGPTDLGTMAVTGSGTIFTPSLTAGGVISPGNGAGTLGVTGNLTLLNTATLLFELGGTTPGTAYDFLNVGGNVAVAGTLAVRFINGFESAIAPGGTFTLLTAGGPGGLTGAFANAANGQRLVTADGFSSFLVNYGAGSTYAANSLVLSNFVAVPEPSTWALMAAGGLLVTWQTLRRRR